VLVDDLITRGVSEPYRMFTSRAEYRLSLREDNADLRLTEAGHRLGLVDAERWEAFNRKRDASAAEVERLKGTWINPHVVALPEVKRVLGKPIEREYSLFDLLRRPEVAYASLMTLPGAGEPIQEADIVEQVEIQAKYHGYIERQKEDVAKMAQQEGTPIPADLDYAALNGLSFEVRQRLAQHRPQTVGQASRIQGVTPAAVAVLLVHLKKLRG
jgi:tRNA uridine 5-carboxymethylaminomethyl modification enzyme